MNFDCWLEYELVDLRTGTRLKQALGFNSPREAQEWYERKQMEWKDTHRVVDAVITMNTSHLSFGVPKPAKSLVERYSGAGSF